MIIKGISCCSSRTIDNAAQLSRPEESQCMWTEFFFSAGNNIKGNNHYGTRLTLHLINSYNELVITRAAMTTHFLADGDQRCNGCRMNFDLPV